VAAVTALKWDVDYELDRIESGVAGGARTYRSVSAAATTASGAQPSFRLIREPRAFRRRRSGPVNPLRWAVLCTLFPAVLLVLYVALWTAAMRTGYQNQRIRDRIAQLKIENDSLQAQMRQLQSPRRIHGLAAQMGMQPSEQVGYIFVPHSRRFSRRTPD
jgi:cell division protein FtsL